MTRILTDIQTEMKRLGWSNNRTATLLHVAGICSSTQAKRYLSKRGDTVTRTAEDILDWLQGRSGSIDYNEAEVAFAVGWHSKELPVAGEYELKHRLSACK